MRDRRDAAIEELRARGVVIDKRGDMKELKESIILATRTDARRFLPRSQCKGKRRHASIDAAIKAAKRLAKDDIGQYRCGYCGHWHNGHAPRGNGAKP